MLVRGKTPPRSVAQSLPQRLLPSTLGQRPEHAPATDTDERGFHRPSQNQWVTRAPLDWTAMVGLVAPMELGGVVLAVDARAATRIKITVIAETQGITSGSGAKALWARA